jgi:hypothetical protein
MQASSGDDPNAAGDVFFNADVEARVPLRRVTSQTAGAGSGLVAAKRVHANEEVFRIKQPLVVVMCVISTQRGGIAKIRSPHFV